MKVSNKLYCFSIRGTQLISSDFIMLRATSSTCETIPYPTQVTEGTLGAQLNSFALAGPLYPPQY